MQMCAIFCNIARLQILYAARETQETENTFTVTYVRKNKRCSTMRQSWRQKTFVARHMPIVFRQNRRAVLQKFLYDKTVIAPTPQSIDFVQY